LNTENHNEDKNESTVISTSHSLKNIKLTNPTYQTNNNRILINSNYIFLHRYLTYIPKNCK